MSVLYLTCGLCGHKQADGLLSRGRWGHLETPAGTQRACPKCKAEHRDWEGRLLATVKETLERRSFSDEQAAAFAATYGKR